MSFLNMKTKNWNIQGVLQKSISSFEDQYLTFSFDKNYQIYANISANTLISAILVITNFFH